jgi:hypothetical protein
MRFDWDKCGNCKVILRSYRWYKEFKKKQIEVNMLERKVI